MSLKDQLNTALKEAMRAGDDKRRGTLRLVFANIKQFEVDKRIEADDAAVLQILQKEIKTRRESIEEAKKGSRQDLIDSNEAEIAILNEFLPKQLTMDELKEIVSQVIAEVGAQSAADTGKVMKAVMPRVQGRAAGDQINQAVRQLLV